MACAARLLVIVTGVLLALGPGVAASQQPNIILRAAQCDLPGNEDSPFCIANPLPPRPDVHQVLATALPDDLFAVDLSFVQPVRLGQLRDFSINFDVPRILARSAAPSPQGGGHLFPSFGLGMLYENAGAWPREVCRARIAAQMQGSDVLEQTRAADWEISEIHVFGTAYAIRELMSGSQMPQARLDDGVAQSQRVVPSFIESVEANIAQPITNSRQGPWPDGCQQFAPLVPVRVLTGTPVTQSEIPEGEDFRSFVQGQLSGLVPDTPVTLQLGFNDPMSVNELADFVARYSIDGALAGMNWQRADGGPAVWTVELSVHGESLAEQVSFQLCFWSALPSGLADELLRASAAAVTISLSAASAWPITVDNNLRAARLLSRFPAGALEDVKSYYRVPLAEREQYGPLADQCANELR